MPSRATTLKLHGSQEWCESGRKDVGMFSSLSLLPPFSSHTHTQSILQERTHISTEGTVVPRKPLMIFFRVYLRCSLLTPLPGQLSLQVTEWGGVEGPRCFSPSHTRTGDDGSEVPRITRSVLSCFLSFLHRVLIPNEHLAP